MSIDYEENWDLQLSLLEHARELVEPLYLALKTVEWEGRKFDRLCCPDCKNYADDGHTDDCGLAAAIAKAEGGGE